MIKIKKPNYRNYEQEIQETYLNIKYQLSEQQADNFFILHSFRELIIALVIADKALNITTSSLRRAKLI